MTTRYAIIEPDCLHTLHERLAEENLSGRCATIYDTNTYRAVGAARPICDQEIVLPAEGLCADDAAITAVLQQLPGDTEVLVAIGGGTLHDIVRYCAGRLGLPFVSCPTAASMDGYTSNCCVIRRGGASTVLPGVAPIFVLADVSIIARAPYALAQAGFGEAISKFITLADWKIASLLADTPLCVAAEAALQRAAILAQGACEGLRNRQPGAYAQLMYALLLCGLVTQLQGNERLVSASEHQLIARMDMLLDGQACALHGEKAGVAAALIAHTYGQLAEVEDVVAYGASAFRPLDETNLLEYFNAPMVAVLMEEGKPDRRFGNAQQHLAAQWQDIRRILAEIPSAETLHALLEMLSAKSTPEALHITNANFDLLFAQAPTLSAQLILSRMLHLIDSYTLSESASRAPSRRSRYADSAIMRAGSSNAVSASSM